MAEIVFAGIALFLFKCGSRNQLDSIASCRNFRQNYRKAFGHRLPDMDTVSLIFGSLPEDELESIKQQLIRQLIEKRVLDKWRFEGDVVVAIDATGIASYDHEHCPSCLTKTSKRGKKTWFHNVLEAKLVTSNGFSISLCTEWIENPGKEYDKQDCERKAYERLAVKLKAAFPRLSICLCADGLYPNNTFFDTCRQYQWRYIVTLKEGNLKRLWERIRLVNRESSKGARVKGNQRAKQAHEWINSVDFNGHTHHWIYLEEETYDGTGEPDKKRFVYLTNIEITHENADLVSATGRLRWNIENQGFDAQKNHGYNICHKFCRRSYLGMKNFYQCCQIAHLLNQLTELSKSVQAMLTGKRTLSFLWQFLLWDMVMGHLDHEAMERLKIRRVQIQFVT